jgi:hypothetical protein
MQGLVVVGLLQLLCCSAQPQAPTACVAVASRMSQCVRPFTFGSKDMETYRTNYPGRGDDLTMSDNLLFYTDQIPSRPDGLNISTMLQSWRGDFNTLEANHGYIQWLFPLQARSGSNPASQEMWPHEIAAMNSDPNVKVRLRAAYTMMLEFYGITLLSNTTGAVARAQNWDERSGALNQNTHNFLRISRILKSLGELGLERFKLPLLLFLANEIYVNGQLPAARASFREFWSESLRNVTELLQMRAIVAQNDGNFDASINPQVCTDLAVCAVGEFCGAQDARCAGQTTFCCGEGTPQLVSGVCQCITATTMPTQSAGTTSTSAPPTTSTLSSTAAATAMASTTAATVAVAFSTNVVGIATTGTAGQVADNGGQTALIVFGVLGLAALIGGVAFLVWRRTFGAPRVVETI